MVKMWDEAVVQILSQGVSLSEFGTKNWALTRRQALDALEQLKLINVPISGGDVYRLSGEKLVPTYDNWYFEDLEELNSTEKSIIFSRNFITKYDEFSDPLFVLVPHLKD